MVDAATPKVRVWDLLVRLTHWSLAALVAINLMNDGSSSIHRWLGTAAVMVIGLRILWGMVATGYANLATFRPSRRAALDYAGALFRGRPSRHLGHNPAAAWMIVTLWFLVGALAITGWMMRIDMFWGEEWLQNLHAALANILLAAVFVHIAAALLMSRVHHENLIAAMLHGFKRAPDQIEQPIDKSAPR